MPSPIILIPARMASTRLPGKPLADICGQPMIVQVWRRAVEAGIGPVVVAAEDAAIVAAVKAAGGEAVLTGAHHLSGSDRIFEAISIYDPAGRYDTIVNVQGDLPTIDPVSIRTAVAPLDDAGVDIATLGVVITRLSEKTDPNVVKIIGTEIGPKRLRALYFTRATAPWGEGPLYHHIGLYTYRREALARFVALKASPLEKREKLEQLRALEAGMRIDAMIVDAVPLGVDTPEELERARGVIGGMTRKPIVTLENRMRRLLAATLIAASIGMPHPAQATADGCAVVLRSPDGFVNLRQSPGARQKIVARLVRGDQLYVDTAGCDTAGGKQVCPGKSGWTHVTSVPRVESAQSAGSGYTRGWVSDRYIRWYDCP